MISTSKVVRPIGSVGATARRTMATGKDIKFGSEGRQGMLAGINKLADAVQSTLGPKGRPSILEQAFGAPKITKDGVTVAKSIEFKDPLENMGAQLMRQAATRTNDVAGDGTTTATTLCRAIATEGESAVAAKLNPMALKAGMSMAVDVVLEQLQEMSTPVTSTEEIASVATISANGDRVVGNLIAEAMERVSREGVISVSDGRTLEDELEVVEGMRFDRGFISPYFITDPKTQTAEFENPLILLVEKKVSTFAPLVPLLEVAIRDSKPLLIIAEDVESDALTSLVMNKLRGGVKVAAVKAPGFGDNRKANLQDLAELTGATVISEETGTKIEDTTVDMLGGCGKVTISKDATLILNGSGSKEAIAARCDTIKDQIAGTKSEYEKEKLQERLAKLAGGVAVIKVGGATEVEVGEKKDRITDALNATRAAVEEGIVPGGGAALLHASKKLAALKDSQTDQSTRVGIEIIERAIVKPAAAIAKNAGVSGDVVVGKLLEEDNPRVGFNALTMEYQDMVAAGIIDPTKVVRTALTDASSIAGLLTITEAVVFEEPDDSPAPAMPPMGGGMGGMGGGMGF